ncbi:zinc finger protein 467 [Liasis olivaceus]
MGFREAGSQLCKLGEIRTLPQKTFAGGGGPGKSSPAQHLSGKDREPGPRALGRAQPREGSGAEIAPPGLLSAVRRRRAALVEGGQKPQGARAAFRLPTPARERFCPGIQSAPKGALPTTSAPDKVTFEDVAVGFSAEEWSLLEGSQRDLHQEVMLEMRSLLLSLGHSVPTLDFSSLICQPEGTAESPSPAWGRRLPFAAGRDQAHCEEPPFADDVERPWKPEQDPAEERLTAASSGEGRDQSSHHLCALMKLVKEIPEFLCGHANASLDRTTPAGGGEGRGHAGPAVQMKSPPCFSRQGALAGLVSLSLSSRPVTPTSSTEGEWPEPSRRGTLAPCPAQGLTGADVATHAEPAAEENPAKGQLEGEDGVFPQRPRLSTEPKGSPQTDPRLQLCPADADGTAGETAERTLASKGRTGGRDQQDGAVPLSAAGRDRDQAPTGAGERSLEDLPPADLGCLDRAGSWREGGADGPVSPGTSRSLSRPGSGSEEGKTVPEAAAEREAPNSACEASPKLVPEATADEKPLQGLLKCLKELIILQPCPAHPAPRKPSAGSRQQVPGGQQREGRSSSLPVQVKTEASTEEPGVCRPREGSGPPATSWGHASPSPAEASRRANSPGRKEGARFPAVKTEQVASSPPGQDPERATGFAVVHAGGSGEGAPDGSGTPAVHVKSEAAAEEEPPLQGWKDVSEEKGCPHFGLPRSGLSLGARESGSKLGLWVPYSADWSPATSPLHGLLNCLKDIPVPRPLPSKVLAGKRGAAGEKERRKGGRRGRIGPPPDAFLPQGPEAGLREKPAQQPLLPLGYTNGTRGRDLGWQKLETTMVQEGLGIPLQGQEGDPKQRPPSAQMQPCSPAVSSSISSSPDRLPWWTPEHGKWRRKEDELGQAHSPLQGLRRGLKERPLSLHSQASSPATSSSPDGLQRWTPEPIQWARREEGLGPNSTPLQGLEKCLKDIQKQRWSPAVSSSLSSSPDRLRQWTPEPVRWARKEEGASPLGIPPLQGLENCLKEIAHSRDFLPDASPAGRSVCAQKQRGTEAESPRPWPGESLLQQCAPSISASTSMEAAAENSPLHRLMTCLKEIPTQRPSYLSTPSVSSASASSSSSSSSSSCSETEREQQSPGSTAWWDCSQGWHQLPDMFQGSEMDALVGQKVTMESKMKHPSVHHPKEEEERLPSIQESKFVDVGDKAPSASLLGNLENDAKDTVVKQMLSSRDPPLCSRAQQDATSGTSEARDDGAPSAPLADKIFTHELQKGPRDPAPVQTPTCSSTPAPESPDRMPEGGTDWSLVEAQVQPQPGPKEGGMESSPLQGLLRCLKEITYGSTSPCSPPARKRPRELRHGQPQPEEEAADSKKKSGEGAVPSSPPVCGVETCPQWNGHACPLSTRSSAHKRDPPGWSNSASLRTGTKRAPAVARDEGGPAPGAAPAPDDAAQDAPRKKRRPGPRAPSPPPPPCSCGGGPPGGAGPLLSKQLGRLAADVGALCRDLSRLRGHVLGLEREARGRALELAALRLENRGLSRYARRLEGRCRALETRSRRHRLRLLGLPEGAEGGDAPGPADPILPRAPPRAPAAGRPGAPLPLPRMVPVRCEDAALHLVPEHWRGWAVHEDTMRENYGAAIALGPPVTKPEIVPQEGGLLPAKAQGARELQQPPDAGSSPPGIDLAVKGEQRLQAAVAGPNGPGEPKDPARSCPGEWLIRTVKVEAEDYSEWPAGLSTEALFSGLPLASACKSEDRVLGPEYKDGGGLGELPGLALQQWQMLSEDKPPGCPRCEHPAAPLGGSLGDPRPRPFTCPQCGKAFGKKAHLTRHARVHTGERPFACTHCGRRFSQKIHLGSHERVHTGERPFPCDRCPKSFRKKTHLVRHQLTHTGERPHACSLCTRSFVHRRHLLRHQRLHEEGAAPPGDHFELGQATPSCGNGLVLGQGVGLSGGFPQSGEATAVSAVLGQGCRVQGNRGQAAVPYRAGMELGKFPTSCVGHGEPDQSPLLFKAEAEPELGRLPGTDRALERDSRPLGEAFPEPGGCGALCGVEAAEGPPCLEQVGKAESEEDAGASQQPEEKPFLCSDCGKAFAWRKNLASHQRLHAEGGRPFSCAECGRGFSDKRHLTAHLRGHMGLLPYACPHCERSFAHRAGLAAHQCGGHVGQRPFACSECGRCFAHKRHLQRHWRNQHSAERPYSCAQCGHTFSTRASLLAHVKSHAGQRPFACPLCGRAFSRKSHLARHEAVHTGLRPHACTQCPRRFSSKTNLVRHQAVHTGLRPYICTHCARSFSRKTHLLRHERTHTSAPLPSTAGWVTALPQSSLLQPPEQRPPLLLPMALESPWQ